MSPTIFLQLYLYLQTTMLGRGGQEALDLTDDVFKLRFGIDKPTFLAMKTRLENRAHLLPNLPGRRCPPPRDRAQIVLIVFLYWATGVQHTFPRVGIDLVITGQEVWSCVQCIVYFLRRLYPMSVCIPINN